jgi:hypothetical protein
MKPMSKKTKPKNTTFTFQTSPEHILAKFGLPDDFLTNLYSKEKDKTESDWAFCLGCCSLMESAMNMTICEVLEMNDAACLRGRLINLKNG